MPAGDFLRQNTRAELASNKSTKHLQLLVMEPQVYCVPCVVIEFRFYML